MLMIWRPNVHTDRRKTYYKKRFWAGILLAQAVTFYLFSQSEYIIHCFERFFESQKGYHQLLFSGVGLSIGDVLYATAVLYFVFLIYGVFRKKTGHRAFALLLMSVNILYFVYQILWGMLYFQKPVSDKMPEVEVTDDELKKLALKYLDLSRQSRRSVKEDRNGVFKIYHLPALKNQVLAGQHEIPAFLQPKEGAQVHSFKPSLFRGVMSYTGISGYYNPFTSEAQYNPELPSTYLPFTLAHESAHQMGYAREQEANFIGFLIGGNSDNPDLRYSTQYFVLRSLLNALAESEPEFVKSVLRNYSAGMKRDRLAEIMFRKRHSGVLEVFFGFTNDLFLKSNRQEGAITYSYFVNLLVRFEQMDS